MNAKEKNPANDLVELSDDELNLVAGGVSAGLSDIITGAGPNIITGAGPGGGPHVKVFDGRTNFEPYPGFTGGVFVAAGDIN